MGEDKGRIDLERALEVGQTSVDLALARQQVTSAGERSRVVRVEPDCLVVIGQGRIELVERGVRVAATGIVIRVAGVELDRLVVLGNRLLLLAQAVGDLTQAAMSSPAAMA